MNAWIAAGLFLLLIAFLALLFWAMVNTPGAVKIGKPAPDFTLTSFKGNTYSTADLRGMVIVVNFWGSWCGICRDEADELQAAWEGYRKSGKVAFLGVDFADNAADGKAYLEAYNVTYPNGEDTNSSISRLYGVDGVPETFIIDQEGILAYVKIGGFASLDEIRTAVDTVLEGE